MKIWNENEIKKAIELILNGSRYEQIGLELGRTTRAVKNKLEEIGYKYYSLHPVLRKKKCQRCNEEFESSDARKKFCSQSCSATYNNSLRNNTLDKKLAECENCGREVVKRFCNNKCQQDFQRKEIFKKIEQGTHKSNDTRIYKSYLYEINGESCSVCGWAERNVYSGIIPLELHHVDGNSDNNCVENLQILCPNHHALTKNWKGITAGAGRHSRRREKRRKNYKDGKSW